MVMANPSDLGNAKNSERKRERKKERKEGQPSPPCLVRNVDVWGPDSVTEPVLSLQTQLVVAGQVGVTESRVLPPTEGGFWFFLLFLVLNIIFYFFFVAFLIFFALFIYATTKHQKWLKNVPKEQKTNI